MVQCPQFRTVLIEEFDQMILVCHDTLVDGGVDLYDYIDTVSALFLIIHTLTRPPWLPPPPGTGGIDERVTGILSLCGERGVTVVHAMSRRRLAVILKKKFKIGCVGVFSYDGAEVWIYIMRDLYMYYSCRVRKQTVCSFSLFLKTGIHRMVVLGNELPIFT